MRSHVLRAATFAFLFATAVSAQQSNPLDFAKGPEQWLLTAEDRRAWRDVKTVQQAEDFIALFWARRDPTPGTAANEYRTDFQQRVSYADKNFKEGRRRGALTERGRVLILLGFPKNLAAEMSKRTSQFSTADGPDSLDPTGGRAQAAREIWEYDRDSSLRFGMPKIEVIFIHDGFDGGVRRDPQRSDFSMALPNAIKYPLVNPELTSVPDWAQPKQVAMVEMTPASEALPQPAADDREQSSVPGVQAPVPVVRAKAAGADRLTLVADAFEIEPQSGGDPFASLSSLTQFKRDSEMGWAAEYCTGVASSELDAVNVALKISGMVNNERINFTAPADEMVPDSIKSSPGCYLVRGAVPLVDMDPGTYDLTVTIAAANGGRSYNLTRQFKVE
jgi:GWxTD domain-containing protein